MKSVVLEALKQVVSNIPVELKTAIEFFLKELSELYCTAAQVFPFTLVFFVVFII